MIYKKIKDNIFYAGMNDKDRLIFDELIPLDKGTSYNSYIVLGSEKTAVIDTMYPKFTNEYIKSFDENGIKKVDYIIANHGEQDHSGSIPALLEKFPQAIVVTNAVCAGNLKEMLFIPPEKIKIIKNDEELSLGDKTLQFKISPGVHWPDTMFTYLKEDNIICTCDFLGAHFIFNDVFAVPSAELERSAKKYFAEIMMPFSFVCRKYVKQLKDLNVSMVLPSHGPIYNKPDYILNLYEDWAGEKGKNIVLLPYVSMYHSTKEMIDYLAKKLEDKGIPSIKYDMVDGNLGDLAIALVDGTTIVLGTSMVLAGPHPAAFNTVYLASVLKPKAKVASFIGSYGWGGNLFGKMTEMLAPLKLDIIEPILVKGKAKQEDYKKLDRMADEIYEKHRALELI
ncbi:MAG: FprA family A-type flavoprotein [Candidatus Gastranaerophilales bacterium]|nr:FprA family A-type flavoprotein [Candidatus Gastranaerophilales bacterium]